MPHFWWLCLKTPTEPPVWLCITLPSGPGPDPCAGSQQTGRWVGATWKHRRGVVVLWPQLGGHPHPAEPLPHFCVPLGILEGAWGSQAPAMPARGGGRGSYSLVPAAVSREQSFGEQQSHQRNVHPAGAVKNSLEPGDALRVPLLASQERWPCSHTAACVQPQNFRELMPVIPMAQKAEAGGSQVGAWAAQ